MVEYQSFIPNVNVTCIRSLSTPKSGLYEILNMTPVQKGLLSISNVETSFEQFLPN